MASTLLLDRTDWDLVTDASGNIAVATEPYAQLQDAASACRVFAGEAYYDTSAGVPYFDQVFNGGTPVQILKSRMAAAAKETPGVADAVVAIDRLSARDLTGQLQVTLDDGTALVAEL